MKLQRFSLTFAILASLACLLILTWLMLSLISFKTAEKDLLAQKSEQSRLLLAAFVSLIPPDPTTIREGTAAWQLGGRLAQEPEFRGLLVLDGSARQVYTLADERGPDLRLRDTLRTGVESFQFSDDGTLIQRYAPLSLDGRSTGAVRLTLSLSREHARLRNSRHLFLAYFILDFVLLMGFGSLLLSRTIIYPIKRLLAATERIAAGDYGQTVHVPGSAEIADLAESFNTMVDALRGKRAEVEQTVASLELANRDLQAAREETIRSEKMASVGLLAAGMAHEIGTPLAAIIGYVGILGDELQDDPVKVDYLRRIESEYGRIDRIVRGLLDYARPTAQRVEQVDPVQLVKYTLGLLQGQGALKHIDVKLLQDRDCPRIAIDPHQLQQVLINLFINARDAMPDGGELLVKIGVPEPGLSEALHASPSGVMMPSRRREDRARFLPCGSGECLAIEVRDCGEGIDADNLRKVFDPFFTTKEPGKGTGLGLAISARIIDSFGGRITVASEVGQGSTFTVLLPVGNRTGD